MYRWLLCLRYLRTRWIALASIVSVTLGVATLIIVNSVMAGFRSQMEGLMHGILSDLVVESHSANGLPNPDWFEKEIRQILGSDVEGVTTVVHVPAMATFSFRGEQMQRQINLIGIDTKTYASVSDFSRFLMHPENRRLLSFDLRDNKYAPERPGFPKSGWEYRKLWGKQYNAIEAERKQQQIYLQQLEAARNASAVNSTVATELVGTPVDLGVIPELPKSATVPPASYASEAKATASSDPTQGPSVGPSNGAISEANMFNPELEQHIGIVLGVGICSTRYFDDKGQVQDFYYVRPGDDLQVGLMSAASPPRILSEKFTVVDLYESKMSEYDSSFAFVPLEKLQSLRGMIDPATGIRSVSSIQIKLRDGADLETARNLLRERFPSEMLVQVSTWRDLQGPLLAAVQMETTILNILLFLIIAVAGFGILATFFMIVVEKTRDIGILKALGAPSSGIAAIFLGYGLLLGAVGALVGVAGGLLFVVNINRVADLLEVVTGQEVFDPRIYYFDRIPTIIHPEMIVSVIFGAMLIAVMASVLPAIRAARLHPVAALRYE